MENIKSYFISDSRLVSCYRGTVDGRNPKQPPGMVKTW